jgi:hypothetical protein
MAKVRATLVLAMHLHWLDLTILLGHLATLASIGVYSKR